MTARIEMIFQSISIGIPTAFLGLAMSLAGLFDVFTGFFGLVGAFAGATVSIMMVIINWKPMIKAAKKIFRR